MLITSPSHVKNKLRKLIKSSAVNSQCMKTSNEHEVLKCIPSLAKILFYFELLSCQRASQIIPIPALAKTGLWTGSTSSVTSEMQIRSTYYDVNRSITQDIKYSSNYPIGVTCQDRRVNATKFGSVI